MLHAHRAVPGLVAIGMVFALNGCGSDAGGSGGGSGAGGAQVAPGGLDMSALRPACLDVGQDMAAELTESTGYGWTAPTEGANVNAQYYDTDTLPTPMLACVFNIGPTGQDNGSIQFSIYAPTAENSVAMAEELGAADGPEGTVGDLGYRQFDADSSANPYSHPWGVDDVDIVPTVDEPRWVAGVVLQSTALRIDALSDYMDDDTSVRWLTQWMAGIGFDGEVPGGF